MAGNTLEKGTTIYTCGQPVTALHLITDGKVAVNYPGGSYQIGKGDVIGICEIGYEVHLVEYVALEDVTFLTYPLSGINALGDLLQKNSEMAKFFLMSACRQISRLQTRCTLSAVDCANLYCSLQENLEKYTKICEHYRLTPRKLAGLEELSAFLDDENPDLWLNDYYVGLARIYKSDANREFLKEYAVSVGILRKCSLDFRKTWMGIDEQFQYLKQVSAFFFNAAEDDLFDFLTSLYYKLDVHSEEKPELLSDIWSIAKKLKEIKIIPEEALDARVKKFEGNIATTTPTTLAEHTEESSVSVPAELVGSLGTILDFAGEDLEIAGSFRQHIQAYKQLPDKNSMEDDACALRRYLTEEFYILYRALFVRTLRTKEVPAPVKMFLFFGYVDEELSGTANTAMLYELLSGMSDNTASGVYTFYEWLVAIYLGKKDPSRNEFEQDYIEYLHKQKATGNITEAQMKQLEQDSMGRVDYELQNLFPTVNKITFGRVTTFCPIFTKDNVLKDLKASFVTVSKLSKAIEQIRKVDFSAFYRPSLDLENQAVMGKESIHRECLPDIILMPNTGVRGAMWQEIEGRRRNTPARMVFSIFFMEDLASSFLRLTGEFRWEMCRRIQGSRWNDLSERSLTSEYFDYVQFHKKNRDLSPDAKERVRASLQRAKNSYKEMFVRDYAIWVLFEGNGSPRLNKVARKILFTYCPFSAQIRETLGQNPLYTELLERHRILSAQNQHRLNTLRKKLLNSGTPVPQTLEQEIRYYSM